MQSIGTNNRIKWIDGIKGLCCIGIFNHHFLLKYAPESYSGLSEIGHNSIASYLSDTFIGVAVNGNFFVFIFIVLSGFVVSRRIMGMSHELLGEFIVNRYLKLSIPILTVELLYYLFFVLHIGGTVLLESDGIDSIFKVIDNALIKVPLYGDTTFAGAFWVLIKNLLSKWLKALKTLGL